MSSSVGMLLTIAMVLFFVLIILIIGYIMVGAKSKNKKIEEEPVEQKATSNYNVKSVFKFMHFEKIEDNMIIQSKGKKFLMVVECQGINYDLMSGLEKNAVETGFIAFLNSLKNPIQIHIQTRTINLENNLISYRDRLKNIEDQLLEQEQQLNEMLKQADVEEKQLNMKRREVIRLRNLHAYAKDIVKNTESMSLNKNILRKKYYIVSSYYYNKNETDDLLSDEEIEDIAFSELYTKCQSMIRVLAAMGVTGKVLNSYELIDLMYNAYNRDSAETFGLNKAIDAGYDQLYVTAPDVFDKKIEELDRVIEGRAMDIAESAILKATEEKQKEIDRKEKNLDKLVDDLAKSLIIDNADMMEKDVMEKALENVDESIKNNTTRKEVDTDGKKTEIRRLRAKK